MIGIRWNKCGGCHGYGFLNETSFHHSFLQRCQAPEFRPVWRSSWLDEPANDCNWKNEAPTVVLISSLRIYFDIYIHFYTTMPAEFMICIYILYIQLYNIIQYYPSPELTNIIPFQILRAPASTASTHSHPSSSHGAWTCWPHSSRNTNHQHPLSMSEEWYEVIWTASKSLIGLKDKDPY